MKLREVLGRWGAEFRSWIRAVLHRRRLEREMEAELQNHLEALTADLMRAGHSRSEAARRARIELGPALMHKEQMRASLGLRWIDEARTDLHYGVRILAKEPGLTLVAAVSLALAIGANTTIFSIAHQLLYQELAVPHPEQLRLLAWQDDGNSVVDGMWGEFSSGTPTALFAYPIYQQLRAHNQVLDDLFAFKEDSMNATIRGNARRVDAVMVSGNYFGALEVQPELGRAIQPSDDVFSATPVAMISDAVWQREFGRSPSVLGQTLTLNQLAFTIVGVAPRGFTGTKGVMEIPDVFVPMTLQPLIDPKGKTSLLTSNEIWWVNVMARSKPGVDDRTAQAALDVQLGAAVRSTMSVGRGETIPKLLLVHGGRGLHVMDSFFKKPINLLLGLTGLVILLACANIANLLLARSAQRQREMSVRLAVGAGRSRILRQLLTESLLLAGMGGALGLVLAYFGRDTLPNLLVNAWERHDVNTPFSWQVFGFTAAVTVITGILFGLAPALFAARTELGSTLKDTAQNATRRRKGLTGKSIVAFQIALSTLLVIGAGLFARTLIALNSIDVGFNPDHLVLFEISPPMARYADGKDVALHTRLEQQIAALPGVQSVTTAGTPYVADSMSNADFLPENENSAKHPAEYENPVGNHFFATLGIPIVAGRGFGAEDTATSEKVAVINQALARKRFPGVNPVGKRFRDGDGPEDPWIRIVGICGDTHYMNLRDDPPAQFFLYMPQWPDAGTMVYEVRTSMTPSAIAPSLRKVVQAADPDLPIINLRTQREQIDATMQMERTFAALTAGFGVLALALACIGVYGIMAYSVAQRTNEIGIRIALGAQPSQVRAMVLRESAWITLGGIAAGGIGALACTRLVRSMLYDVAPNDPATIAAGVAVLLAIALAATWIPARRAAGIQPMEALRHE